MKENKKKLTRKEQAILEQLEENNWNRAATARQIGCHERHLYRIVKKLRSLGYEIPTNPSATNKYGRNGSDKVKTNAS